MKTDSLRTSCSNPLQQQLNPKGWQLQGSCSQPKAGITARVSQAHPQLSCHFPQRDEGLLAASSCSVDTENGISKSTNQFKYLLERHSDNSKFMDLQPLHFAFRQLGLVASSRVSVCRAVLDLQFFEKENIFKTYLDSYRISYERYVFPAKRFLQFSSSTSKLVELD